jgi:ankyrin repeat protein
MPRRPARWTGRVGKRPPSQGGRVAEYLLDRGADLNWIGWDDLTPLDVAIQSDAADLAEWLRSKGAKTASDLA